MLGGLNLVQYVFYLTFRPFDMRTSRNLHEPLYYLLIKFGLKYPYAPFMENLRTFTINLSQMQVDIPYMEHMG